MSSDIYADLIAAEPGELLETAIMFYEMENPGCGQWLRLGFKIAMSGGWENIAPAWLRSYREKFERKDMEEKNG